MAFLLLFLALGGEDTALWTIEETEIYQPLRTDEVLVRPDGQVYILNYNESHVRRFDSSGQLLGKIGRRGKGPGEFTYPSQFFFMNGRLFVTDILTISVSIFEPDGTFVKRVTLPNRQISLVRVNQGWFYGDWKVLGREEKAGLYFANEDWSETQKLMTIEKEGFDGGTWIWTRDGKTTGRFNPFNNRPQLVVSRDGKKVFITDTETLSIHVIDVASRKKVASLSLESPRIPFDFDWANERLKQVEERQRQHKVKFETNFPEFFPVIRQIVMDPSGHLVVDRWRGRPDENHYPIALDQQGNEKNLDYPWEVLERIAAVHDGHAYVTLMNEEVTDEAALAKVPLSQVVAFVAKNPVVFEGSSGRSYSISD